MNSQTVQTNLASILSISLFVVISLARVVLQGTFIGAEVADVALLLGTLKETYRQETFSHTQLYRGIPAS